MKNTFILTIAACAIIATGCNRQNLDDIRETEALQELRLAELEKWQAEYTQQLSTMQDLVTKLAGYSYVKSYKELADHSGYDITFEDGKTITLKHGIDGTTPVISAAKIEGELLDGEDANMFYWTINKGNGVEFITDADGKKVPLTSKAPEIRINSETGIWEYLPYGASEEDGWVSLNQKANGGNNLFASVGLTESSLYLQLAQEPNEDNVIHIPLYRNVYLPFIETDKADIRQWIDDQYQQSLYDQNTPIIINMSEMPLNLTFGIFASNNFFIPIGLRVIIEGRNEGKVEKERLEIDNLGNYLKSQFPLSSFFMNSSSLGNIFLGDVIEKFDPITTPGIIDQWSSHGSVKSMINNLKAGIYSITVEVYTLPILLNNSGDLSALRFVSSNTRVLIVLNNELL